MIKKWKPMAHQQVSLEHDQTTPIVFDMSDAGTGKTAVRIWAYARRRRLSGRARAGCLLVLAPRSLLRTAWANDFAKFAPELKVSVATSDNRGDAFRVDADVYITNHDAVTALLRLPKPYWKKFSELAVDEATAYKHHTSKRSRAAAKIRSYFQHVALMTATPTSNGICDIWHQAYLLDGGKRLGPNFYQFRNSVCTPFRAVSKITGKTARNVNAIRWEDKDGAEEAVYSLLADIVVRHKFENCVDIPATHQYTVEYELPKKQRLVYETMAAKQILQLKATKITAINASAVATKLLQIASGAVYDGSGDYVVIDRGRYETLIEMASVRKHPVVFFFWKHQRDLLTEEADKRGLTYCVLDGEATDAQRTAMWIDYQAGKYDVMFGHPKSMAHGLTLTRGTSVIWSGPTYDLEWWKQGNRRQARIGQKAKTEVVVMLAPGTIEELVYNDVLMSKSNRMSNLLDLFGMMSVPRELEAA